MAQIGQIVYNLQDFHSSGGLISTSQSNLSSTVSSNSDNYETSRINIFESNLVTLTNAASFTKLGIQAPPGTKVSINGQKIMIGRTGVYELDDGIKVTSLQFDQSQKYVIDKEATDNAFQKGKDDLERAKEEFETAVNGLDLNSETYWEDYNEIYKKYTNSYNVAFALYTQGVNGIYKLSDEYIELYNVIIDFCYGD